jgi:predicted amidohydrolase
MTEKLIRRPAKGVRVAVAQIAPVTADLEANLARHAEMARRAAEEGADLLVFPELSLTGCRLGEHLPELAAARGGKLLAELAAISHDVSIVAGCIEESRELHFHDAAVYFESGRLVTVHQQVYLSTFEGFAERRQLGRGHRITAFDTRSGRMAILIGEDFLHPTAVTIAALDGATTLIVPAASPLRGTPSEDGIDSNARHEETYARVMARDLGLHVVYCNRCGAEEERTYWGGSEVIGPGGETLAKAAYHGEDFISAVLSDDAVRRRRRLSPVLREEDVDVTINELARLRGRTDVHRRPKEGPPQRDRGFDRGRGGGWSERGSERDRRRWENDRDSRDRGRPDAPRDRDFGGDLRRGGPSRARDDRGRPTGASERDFGRDRDRDRWGPPPGRGGFEPRDSRGRNDRRSSRNADDRRDEGRGGNVPPRFRPERGAQKPRPVGGARGEGGPRRGKRPRDDEE